MKHSKSVDDAQIRAAMDHGPCRVVIDKEGAAVTPFLAESRHGVSPDIMFIRDDGWTLGAPLTLESVAFGLWSDKWIGYTYLPKRNFKPIESHPLKRVEGS